MVFPIRKGQSEIKPKFDTLKWEFLNIRRVSVKTSKVHGGKWSFLYIYIYINIYIYILTNSSCVTGLHGKVWEQLHAHTYIFIYIQNPWRSSTKESPFGLNSQDILLSCYEWRYINFTLDQQMMISKLLEVGSASAQQADPSSIFAL